VPLLVEEGFLMTHMHIPDGVLPVWIWLLGLVFMAGAIAACVFRLRAVDLRKKIPILGAVSAVMLVAMSLEILPLAYHINLSVVAGILLGPSLGFLAAFITNLVLALMGHGGITVLGLNTLLLGSEAILGHVLFYLFKDRFTVFWRAVVVTIATLLITTTALIGIVAVSHVDPEIIWHAEDHGHEAAHASAEGEVTVMRFATMVLSLGIFGWIIEAFITGAVIRFISQVKPDLLRHVLHAGKNQ
jgi:cobalt/nickel transport system permease protein